MGRNKYWTKAEQEHLTAHYGSISSKRLQELLQGRTERAINDQALRMGLAKRPERLEEMGRENVLRRWYPPEIKT